MTRMRITTLLYLLGQDFIWLGEKKTSLGAGKINGFGGKKRIGETAIDAAVRETAEEVGVLVKPKNILKVGRVIFRWPHAPENSQSCHIYIARSWRGEPRETEAMKPVRIPRNAIPYECMWKADTVWMPLMLSGNIIDAEVVWSSPGTFNPFEPKIIGQWSF